jgi:molybdenum cofactor cytidylyltransferase
MISPSEQLGVGRSELVSFVGAGGKTTLLLGLGTELAPAATVIMTTTTKMGVDQLPNWASICRTEAEVATAQGGDDPIFVVGGVVGEKVTGVDPGYADDLFAANGVDYVLVEADGARRRSLKAPAAHEPVTPKTTTIVVALAGLDAIGGRIGEVTHRPERVAALTGQTLDDLVTPTDIARVVGHPDGGLRNAPDGSRVVVALTKIGAEPDPVVVSEIASQLHDESRIDRVVAFAIDPGWRGSGSRS